MHSTIHIKVNLTSALSLSLSLSLVLLQILYYDPIRVESSTLLWLSDILLYVHSFAHQCWVNPDGQFWPAVPVVTSHHFHFVQRIIQS